MNLFANILEQFKKYPHLRILFFFDAKREMETEFDELQTALDAQSVVLVKARNHFFRLKYRLETEWAAQKILLYLPMERPGEHSDFILYDLLVANKEFKTDDVDKFIEEYGLHNGQHRALVKRYIQYMHQRQFKNYVEEFFTQQAFTKENLQKAFASQILGFKNKRETNELLIQLFILHSTEDHEKLNKKLAQLRELDAEQFLLDAASQLFKSNQNELTPDYIKELVERLKYNLITAHFAETHEKDTYSKYKITSPGSLSGLKTLWRDWELNEQLKNKAFEVFKKSGNLINELRILEIYGFDAPYYFYTPAMAYAVNFYLLPVIFKKPEQADKIFAQFSQVHYAAHDFNYFIGFAIKFYHVYNGISTYTLNRITDYFAGYTSHFAQIDSYYRKLVLHYTKHKLSNFEPNEQVESFFEQIQKDYDSFLVQLNTEWQKLVQEESGYYFAEIPKQWEFYQKHIKPQAAKKVVIISDAFRYEAAMELSNKLKAEYEYFPELHYMVAQLPSRTDVGMAALLPHEKIDWIENQPKINGISTQGKENREKILKIANPEARVLLYNEFKNLSEKELRDVFKQNLVYIYHDAIDAIGDQRKTEEQTFEAVEKAINDLALMIKRIHATMGVSHVYVTADHGFIYQHKPIAETMFSINAEHKSILDSASRYIISSDKIDEKSLISFPVEQMSNVNTKNWISFPVGINRFKKQGVGYQFVHGGMSLQEIIVPLLISKKAQKAGDLKKVTISLINKSDKVSANAYKVVLQQIEQISVEFSSRKTVCGMYNQNNQLVSDEKELFFNSSSPLPTERKISAVLQLGSNAGHDSFLYLRIYDADDKQRLNILLEHKVENASLESSDDFS